MTMRRPPGPWFGLAAGSWTGPSWLGHLDGEVAPDAAHDATTTSVWRHHGTQARPTTASPWCAVGTVPFGVGPGGGGADPDQVARAAVHQLTNLSLPTALSGHEEYLAALGRLQRRAVEDRESWARTDLVVGTTLPARTWRWAGWEAVVAAADGAGVVVVTNRPGGALAVAGLTSLECFGRDDDRLPWPQVFQESRRAALGDTADGPGIRDPHPDQLALLD